MRGVTLDGNLMRSLLRPYEKTLRNAVGEIPTKRTLLSIGFVVRKKD
jgi:hypothetical protein